MNKKIKTTDKLNEEYKVLKNYPIPEEEKKAELNENFVVPWEMKAEQLDDKQIM
jgi:hypothetical protein